MPRSRYWWIPPALKPYLRPLRDRLRTAVPKRWQPRSRPDPAFHCAVDPLPERIGVGLGSVLFVSGYCFHLARPLKRVEIEVDGRRYPAEAHGMPRSDIRDQYAAVATAPELPFYSGFWALVPLHATPQPRTVTISVIGHFADRVRRSRPVASPTVTRRPPDAPQPLTPDDIGREQAPTVVICMATYNPPIDLFRVQIESIRAQTYEDWLCIINDDCSRPDLYAQIEAIVADDNRFVLFRNSDNIGFYRNFERCLYHVPLTTRFVALSDQDDNWYAEKLDTLITAMHPDVTLAYGDMRIIDRDGAVVSTSFWENRPNNHTNITKILIDNTITGAASLFRTELLSVALPLPWRSGNPFHDHWLACLALASGRVQFVGQPLQDYVQHGSNVIGFPAEQVHPRRDFVRAVLAFQRAVRAVAGTPVLARSAQHGVVGHWRAVYFWDVLRVETVARVLLLRLDAGLKPRTRRELRRIARLDSTSALWFTLRAIRQLAPSSPWLSGDPHLLRGVLWKRRARLVDGFVQPVLEYSPDRFAESPEPGARQIGDIQHLTRPLKLRVVAGSPRRVNILVQTLDWNYFFGGYITVGALALRLAAAGWRVRLIVLSGSPLWDTSYRRKLEGFQDMEGLFSKIEILSALNRERPVEVCAFDVVMATTAWTAHVAHAAMEELGGRPFIFVIGEYEGFVHPNGTFSALARQSYTFKHCAIFSSTLLRDYFVQERLGVFASGETFGLARSTVLLNPITDVGIIEANRLLRRRSRRLLFYARPEEHAARNMFELGVLALGQAIERGVFDSRWEFFGVGAIDRVRPVKLPCGRQMQMLPRQDQDAYAALLREHDVGLSLMDTPHPSLVPIEMATAGMLAVTTTYANKTREALEAISSNIIGVAPTVDGVAAGLAEAVRRVTEIDARVAGSRVDWPRSAREAFDDVFLARFRQFVEDV